MRYWKPAVSWGWLLLRPRNGNIDFARRLRILPESRTYALVQSCSDAAFNDRCTNKHLDTGNEVEDGNKMERKAVDAPSLAGDAFSSSPDTACALLITISINKPLVFSA